MTETYSDVNAQQLNRLSEEIHRDNVEAGWYTDVHTGLPKTMNVGERLMLCVSELSEAMEGDRKNLQDDKLPHRKMIEVELADCVIRILDLAAHLKLDIGGAVEEKRAYNSVRLDHKLESRLATGGKAY